MTITPKDVEQYYQKKFTFLSQEKQFHFASRLFLFSHGNKYNELIENLRSFYIWKQEDVKCHIDESLINKDGYLHKIINHKPFRINPANKYPLIGSYNHILFKILFHKSIYNMDYSAQLFSHEIADQMHAYYTTLLHDHKSIFSLSTHAINFIFLFKHFFKNATPISISNIEKIAQNHSNSHTHDTIQSSIYLLTHIIICESLFYSVPIHETRKECLSVFYNIEKIILNNYLYVSLDQKLEFLVCGIILNTQTSLKDKIMNEAMQSKAPKGSFIIDTHNNFKDIPRLQTLNGSEHRNVLYVLTNYQYLCKKN